MRKPREILCVCRHGLPVEPPLRVITILRGTYTYNKEDYRCKLKRRHVLAPFSPRYFSFKTPAGGKIRQNSIRFLRIIHNESYCVKICAT